MLQLLRMVIVVTFLSLSNNINGESHQQPAQEVAPPASAAAEPNQSQKVLLTSVDVINLWKDKYITSRRSRHIPQLRCLNSDFFMCSRYSPDFVQCLNRGYDGVEFQWDCKADLDKTVKFGYVKVTCEGFDHPDDRFIVQDSCALEFLLKYATNFYEKSNEYYRKDMYEANSLSNFLSLLVMMIIIYAIYKACSNFRGNESSSAAMNGFMTTAGLYSTSSQQPYGHGGHHNHHHHHHTHHDFFESNGSGSGGGGNTTSPFLANRHLDNTSSSGAFPPPPPSYESVVRAGTAGSGYKPADQQEQQTPNSQQPPSSAFNRRNTSSTTTTSVSEPSSIGSEETQPPPAATGATETDSQQQQQQSSRAQTPPPGYTTNNNANA